MKNLESNLRIILTRFINTQIQIKFALVSQIKFKLVTNYPPNKYK